MQLDTWMAKTELVDATKFWTTLASEEFKIQLRDPLVEFGITGRVAGRAWHTLWKIQYNMELFQLNRQDFLDRTVPHEVAHLVSHTLYPGCSAHGHEWRSVMTRMGVKDITRCHSYDTSKLTTGRARPYVYKCRCREHSLSNIVHRRISAGQHGVCKRCKERVIFVRTK